MLASVQQLLDELGATDDPDRVFAARRLLERFDLFTVTRTLTVHACPPPDSLSLGGEVLSFLLIDDPKERGLLFPRLVLADQRTLACVNRRLASSLSPLVYNLAVVPSKPTVYHTLSCRYVVGLGNDPTTSSDGLFPGLKPCPLTAKHSYEHFTNVLMKAGGCSKAEAVEAKPAAAKKSNAASGKEVTIEACKS